jgi:hypothetical protein
MNVSHAYSATDKQLANNLHGTSIKIGDNEKALIFSMLGAPDRYACLVFLTRWQRRHILKQKIYASTEKKNTICAEYVFSCKSFCQKKTHTGL